jgi:hypothetical protein
VIPGPEWFRGRHDARGFLLDVQLVGPATTRQRILGLWTDDARLLALDETLLLILPTTISVRAERAPGQLVLADGAKIRIPRNGEVGTIDPTGLPNADLSWLVDLDLLRYDVAKPVPSMAALRPATPARSEARPKPDMRRLAGIGNPNGALGRGLRDLQREHERSARQSRRGGQASGAGAGPAKRRRTAELLLRTPAQGFLGRRHAKYVEKLSQQFQGRNWETALRSAISLGGNAGALSLRLPKMRDLVRGPSKARNQAGGTVPYGQTLQAHLGEMYRAAATQLEAEDQLMLAAFVHADLLHNPAAAVELLERHGEYAEAAQLAEGWELDPALGVRLWWRAGDRARAIRLGRARGAFAAAIAALARIDETATVDLRRAWMEERREAGDHLGVVEAAWPVLELRPETIPDIAAGMAGGAATAGTLLAYLVGISATGAEAEVARRLVADPDPEAAMAKHAFLVRFAEIPAIDSTVDRELASTGLLATLDHQLFASSREALETRRQLKGRADPLLAADLPPGRPPAVSSAASEPLQLDLTGNGQFALFDAVALGPDTILMALGEIGLRLVDHRGKVRARWDVPTHRLVVADNGNRVLLVADRGGVQSVHRLDLPMSKPVPLPPIRAEWLLDGYDGARPVIVTSDGIQWLHQRQGAWQVDWTELTEPQTQIHQVARTPTSLAALHSTTELRSWRWELPTVALRARTVAQPAPKMYVLATGELASLSPAGSQTQLTWHTQYGQPIHNAGMNIEPESTLFPVGDGFALVSPSLVRSTASIYPAVGSEVLLHADFHTTTAIRARTFRGLVTLSHPGGNLAVVDIRTRQQVADLRTRL